jgi:predicted RNA-binding protein YlxR (DUF448 family)
MCALTRRVLPEGDLIRFVAAPDGTVVADLKARLPGRGVWIGLARASVAEAARRNVFARGLKQPVRPAADLADQVAARLKAAALGRLGLARKAGDAVAGFSKVEAALAHPDLCALIIASDAAENALRKMEKALREAGKLGRKPVFRSFASSELDLAIGRPNVIHAAVLQGPAGRSFAEAAIRLVRYEGAGGDNDGSRPAERDSGNE